MIKKFFGVTLQPASRALSDLAFSPASLDLHPGEVGTVTVSGVDQFGQPFPITAINSVITPTTGVTITKSGKTFTVTAPPGAGPAAPTPIVLDVDVS